MSKSKNGFGQGPHADAAGPETPAPLPINPVVAAAQEALVELFDTLAKDWPALINPSPSSGGPMQPYTKEMLALLSAQLRRALGVTEAEPKK